MTDWLVRISTQSGVALLLLAIVARLGARLPARTRCWIFRMGYLKCLAALLISSTIPLPLLPAAPAPTAPTIEASAPAQPLHTSSNPQPIAAALSTITPAVAQPAAPVRRGPTVAGCLMILYLSGVALSLLRLLASIVVSVRLTRQARVIDDHSLTTLSARFGLRHAPRVARLANLQSPLLTFGAILLPEPALAGEELIVAHELAHAKRRDLLWEVLGALTQACYWFHPLIWWARREEKLAREQAADALALEVTAARKADYARVLLSTTLQRTPALAVGAFEKPSGLRRRLSALVQPSLPVPQARLLLGVAGLSLIPALLPWSAIARPTAPSLPEPPPTPAVVAGTIRTQRGHVVDSHGQPIRNARVLWVLPGERTPIVYSQTVTDPNGVFTLPTLQEKGLDHLNGWLTVEASAFGRFSERRTRIETDLIVHLQPAQTRIATFQDTSGQPIANLRVWVKEAATNGTAFPMRWLGYDGLTDAHGEFRIAGVNATDALTIQFDPARWVQTDPGNDNPNRFVLAPARTLEGRVTFPDGRPASRIRIAINGSGPTRSVFAHGDTDDAGRYKIVGLPPGDYRLLPEQENAYEGLTLPNSRRFAVAAVSRTTRLDIALAPSALIIGQITNAGQPVATRIHVGDIETASGRDGRYALLVPAGTATLQIGVTPYQTLTLSPNETQLADVNIAMSTP